MTAIIHPSAHVQATAIGARTRIWQYVVILSKAVIGLAVGILHVSFGTRVADARPLMIVQTGKQDDLRALDGQGVRALVKTASSVVCDVKCMQLRDAVDGWL